MASGLHIGSIEQLARQIEGDILRRGLAPGDRYMTASEAGSLLGVSTTTASRAMKLLADRQKLIRKRNQGTYIGPRVDGRRAIKVRTVMVLMPASVRHTTGVVFDVLLDAVSKKLNQANMQVSFVPPENDLAYVREIVEVGRASRHLAGVVAISCSHDVYRYLDDRGVPTVVFGTLYPDLQHMPSLDMDYHQAGRLLAAHLLERGHRRLALLCNQSHRPGDDTFLEGVTEALSRAGLPANALIVRTAAPTLDSVPGQIDQLLRLPDAPTAMIARSRPLAQLAITTLRRDDGSTPDFDIVFDDYLTDQSAAIHLVRASSTLRFEQIAARIGDMLSAAIHRQPIEPSHVVIPTKLVLPAIGHSR